MIASSLDDSFLNQLRDHLGGRAAHISLNCDWHSEGKSGRRIEIEVASTEEPAGITKLLTEIDSWQFALPGYFVADIVAENSAPLIASDHARFRIAALLLED